MNKARLIKRNEIIAGEQDNPNRSSQQSAINKTTNEVSERVKARKARRNDPRKAFAALFSQSRAAADVIEGAESVGAMETGAGKAKRRRMVV